ncbi:hypothetical protein BDZ89DRAFT_1127142 [Hymenopellis radicata]|nr:hypothetical protein BDZ89DRAFT_1127142 [Hymenopellis radicata]
MSRSLYLVLTLCHPINVPLRLLRPLVQKQPSSSIQAAAESSKPFNRIRSSLEQSLRTATRSKKQAPLPVDEFATITQNSTKGKERASEDAHKDKERTSGMLRKTWLERWFPAW